MFAQHESVVRCQNQRSVFPHVVGIEITQDSAEQIVAQAEQREVISTQFIDLVPRFGQRLAGNPASERAMWLGRTPTTTFPE